MIRITLNKPRYFILTIWLVLRGYIERKIENCKKTITYDVLFDAFIFAIANHFKDFAFELMTRIACESTSNGG